MLRGDWSLASRLGQLAGDILSVFRYFELSTNQLTSRSASDVGEGPDGHPAVGVGWCCRQLVAEPIPVDHAQSARQVVLYQQLLPFHLSGELTYVALAAKLTHMTKAQVYLPDQDLEELRSIAERTGRSVADLVREAVRRVWLRPDASGPVALWDGTPTKTSAEHDAIYDRS